MSLTTRNIRLFDANGVAIPLGQATKAASLPVTIASDQTVPVWASPVPTVSGGTTGQSFGQVTTVSTTQIVLETATYTEPAANGQRAFVSSAAADAAAGTGCQTASVTWMNAAFADFQSENVTLNGVTRVNTVGTTLAYIEDIRARTVGSGGQPAGTLSLVNALTPFATVWSIPVGNLFYNGAGCHHYVPTGRSCYIASMEATVTTAILSYYWLRSKNIGLANAMEITISGMYTGLNSSPVAIPIAKPIVVAGPSRIQGWMRLGTATSTGMNASFNWEQF